MNTNTQFRDIIRIQDTSDFISENFLLENKTAEHLYHNYAKHLPIIDYHCHLSVDEIAANKNFENLTKIWLNGDHYKWRAMRTNGVPEMYITGEASDWEKFLAWAKTVPYTLRNPLYHWTHMELKYPFGINDKLLNGDTARDIWEECNALLNTKEFYAKELIKKFNVETICTTDDPTDSLEFHKQLIEDKYEINILPAFRPDKARMIENIGLFNLWFNKLQEVTDIHVNNFRSYIDALRKRHNYFHDNGCRLSDHGLEITFSCDYTSEEIEKIFSKVILNKELNRDDILKFNSAMLFEFGIMDSEKNWTQQYHIGALRNANSRMYNKLGPDTGYDSIGDFETARPLAKFLNRLDSNNQLAKTIIYNLNPADNELIATMIGNFQDSSVPGKIQFGSGWWFLDQKDGIERQLNVLSNMGLLSRFVGMLTDSRSFLSYPRHDYFRRVLCNLIGKDVENGLIPNSDELIVPVVENICYFNSKNYFAFNNK
ncbi:MAG: glucuronate isomerase [Ignavibacteriaceae bacterium]|nr:glucuronate isomerase [Ignavibacteriaceae bacterium]